VSREQGFREREAGISYSNFSDFLSPWVIKLWTYKIVGENIYYCGRINEYMKYLTSEKEGII
jgi:hypothetical protein